MEFQYLRGILQELRMELGVLFEHGLAQGERQEPALREHGARLAENGMPEGAGITAALCDELARARVDTQWTADAAAAQFARLWKYIAYSLRQLEFLEAEANLLTEVQ